MNKRKGTYGVHWREINRAGFIIPREKFFQTERALNRFIEKLEEKDNFVEVIELLYPSPKPIVTSPL